MQILLGAQSTLVKIQDSRNNFQHILNFIESQFERKIVRQNSIYIPSSESEYHKRIFLMKWLYSYYTRKYTKPIPNLKSVLLARVAKPIYLQLPPLNTLPMTIEVEFALKSTCFLRFEHISVPCEKAMLSYFEDHISMKDDEKKSFEITVGSLDDKKRLKNFLYRKKIRDEAIVFRYDVQAYQEFFSVEPLNSDISKACQLLNVNIEDPLKQIRRNYINLAKKWHPDLLSDKTEAHIRQGTQYFQTLLAAFDLLKVHKKAS